MNATVLALLENARRAGDPSLLARWIPYAVSTGISAELRDGAILGVMRYSEHLVGNRALPALHGGVLGALLETTAIFQLLWTPDTTVLPRTINITVDYVRSARPQDTFASAHVARLGRRVAHVQARAWQGQDREHVVAVAHGNFAITAPAG